MVLNLNSNVGGIPHREANIRVDEKVALNRGNHEESKGTFSWLIPFALWRARLGWDSAKSAQSAD